MPPFFNVKIRAGLMRFDSITMAKHNGPRIFALPLPQQGFETMHLGIGEAVPANKTDAKAVIIDAFDMRALPIFRASSLTQPITANHIMIANPVPAKAKMHLLNIYCAQRLVIRCV